MLRSPTLFEDVVRTILTTNTLWAATKRMCLNLVEQFGQPLETQAGEDFAAVLHPLQRAFPTPERLAATDEAALREQTRLGYRAPYILALAREVASGALDLEALKHSHLPTPELRKRLLAIKGIGGYAVAVLLMILGRYDFDPGRFLGAEERLERVVRWPAGGQGRGGSRLRALGRVAWAGLLVLGVESMKAWCDALPRCVAP